MEATARIWFTPQQRAELWERWKNGQCVADIARALERRNKSGVYRILAVNGGIAPEPRRRAAGALRLEEREEISRGIAAGRSMRRIAQGRRNGSCSACRAGEADRRAWERALRPKRCRLARHARLRWRIAQKLALQWSPEQISGWLKRQLVWPGVRLSIALVSRECLQLHAGDALMRKLRVLRTASLSIFFLLSGFALAHAQALPPEPTEPPSRLSMFVHDVTNWFDHVITDAEHITHSPPLPRPRPAELASAHVASIQELLESKKKTPTPVQIND